MVSLLSKQKRKLGGQRGQMAIFIALIFQILFVFFAMAINIGLVVHDKINLQNAVDLAAFYAAQRQAEMLNVMAHSNYQIRQSWKLLNWRYYVLGTMGATESQPPHPARGNAPRSEQIWQAIANSTALCITYGPIWKDAPADNVCKSQNFSVPNIEIPKIVAPFLPFNFLFRNYARSVQDSIAQTCNGYAGNNWLFTASIFTSYLLDQMRRKETIYALARNLAREPREIVDLEGDTIFSGAEKTFRKNLTAPNASSVEQFEILNPLQGLDPQAWLPSQDVWFTLIYQETIGTGNNCTSELRQVHQQPGPQAWARLQQLDSGGNIINTLLSYAQSASSISAGDNRRLTIGVEKNPWIWAYVGVKATTKPRQLFFPFGEPIEFTAYAYAQPFGGRIGPWYSRYWPKGSPNSAGDPLQISPEKLQANGILNSQDAKKLVPQYGRYPGDQLGLKSLLAQQSLKNQLTIKTRIIDYKDIFDLGEGTTNDVVAYSDDTTYNIRRYEIASVAPDLFDVTYYSIQPNFGERYLPRLRAAKDALQIPDLGFPRGDLGSREPQNLNYSVRDQLKDARGQGQVPGPDLQEQDAFWYIREPQHLLTSWVHNDTYGEYADFPEKRFGKCVESDEEYNVDAPGGCMDNGGRAGYSVKIVSPEMFRAELNLGGPGQGAGTIENPPPDDW